MKAVIDTIVEFSPARMGNFTLSTFYSMYANLTSNQVMSLLALEFPPYWCFLIVSAISGDKTSIYHTLKTLNLKRDAILFQNDLLKTNTFIKSL